MAVAQAAGQRERAEVDGRVDIGGDRLGAQPREVGGGQRAVDERLLPFDVDDIIEVMRADQQVDVVDRGDVEVGGLLERILLGRDDAAEQVELAAVEIVAHPRVAPAIAGAQREIADAGVEFGAQRAFVQPRGVVGPAVVGHRVALRGPRRGGRQVNGGELVDRVGEPDRIEHLAIVVAERDHRPWRRVEAQLDPQRVVLLRHGVVAVGAQPVVAEIADITVAAAVRAGDAERGGAAEMGR